MLKTFGIDDLEAGMFVDSIANKSSQTFLKLKKLFPYLKYLKYLKYLNYLNSCRLKQNLE